MKKTMFLVALLAIPALAFAGTATMSLKLSDGSYAKSVDVATLPATISVLWGLDSYAGAPNGIANVDAYMTASASNVFKVTARSFGTPFSAGFFAAATNPTLFVNLAPDSANIGALATGGSGPLGNYLSPDDQATPWTLNTLTIQVLAGTPVGSYTLQLKPGYFAGTTDATGEVPEQLTTGQADGPITITVTPEPATMLLLTLALPFLRRRSA